MFSTASMLRNYLSWHIFCYFPAWFIFSYRIKSWLSFAFSSSMIVTWSRSVQMLAYSISNRNSFIGILAAETCVLIVVYFWIKLKYKFVSVKIEQNDFKVYNYRAYNTQRFVITIPEIAFPILNHLLLVLISSLHYYRSVNH